MSNRLFWVYFHKNIIESLVSTTLGEIRFKKFFSLYGRMLPNGNIELLGTEAPFCSEEYIFPILMIWEQQKSRRFFRHISYHKRFLNWDMCGIITA
jgi:hypothetical protein